MLDDVRRTLAGASHMPITEQMARRCRSIFTDLAVLDGQLVGRDRQQVGYLVSITGTWLNEWATRHIAAWTRQGMTAADWTTVAELLGAWVAERDAAVAAAVPQHERQLQRLDAERRTRARRAELEAERDRADAELAALGGDVQQDTESPADPSSRLGDRLFRRPAAS